MKPKIVNCSYGIASRYDGLIEINKDLPKTLRSKVLKHELSHTNGRYTMKDFKVDFQSKNPHFYESLSFSLRHPEAFIGYFPIMYSYYLSKWTFNSTSVIFMAFYGIIFGVMATLALKISFFLAILFFFNLMVVANIGFLLYTHINIKVQNLKY